MATAAGQHIQDPSELATLQEGDIARISGSDSIYRRDLAREQEAMKTYTGGRGTKELDQAFNKFVYVGPDTPATPAMPEVPSTDEVATGMADLPTPPEGTAGVIQDEFVKISSDMSQRSTAMNSVYQQQMADNLAEQEEMRKQLETGQAKVDADVSAMGDLMQDDIRTRLEEAGNKEFELKEKYARHTELTNGLVEFAEQAIGMINTEKQRVGLAAIKGNRISNVMDDINSKIALTQSSLAAISNNIALGRTFIDRGIEAAVADRADNLNYLNFVYELSSADLAETKGKVLNLEAEEKQNLENQINLLDSELLRIDAEKDMVAEFLVGDNAYAALQAGVNLTDSYDEMIEKVVNYYKQNPNQVLLQGLTSGQRIALEESGMTFDAKGNLVTSTATITSTGETGSFGLEILDTGGPAAGNRSDRNNNPLNIKASNFTSGFKGVIGIEGSVAADGGNFLVFDSPDSGFAAARKLWREGSPYKGVSVATGLERWSGGGYGADVAQQAGIDPNRDAQSLNEGELQNLFAAMARREGYTGVGNSVMTNDVLNPEEGGDTISFEDFKNIFETESGMSVEPNSPELQATYDEYLKALENQGLTSTNYADTYQGYSLKDLKDLVKQDSDQEKMGALNLSPNDADDIKEYLGLKTSGQLSDKLSKEEKDEFNFSNTEKNKLENEFGSNWRSDTTRQQQLDFLYNKKSSQSDFDKFVESLGITE